MMNRYQWMDGYILAKPGAEKDYKEEWNATRYMIRGKIFAMLCGDKAGKPIINVKLAPDRGEFLRRMYPDIVPAYYMNKVHWNSLYLEGDVPGDELRSMLDESHGLVLASLSKKAQGEILGR